MLQSEGEAAFIFPRADAAGMEGYHMAANNKRFSVGGDLSVSRLGFGAIRFTGEGSWGEPNAGRPATAWAALPPAGHSQAGDPFRSEWLRLVSRGCLAR